MFADYGRMKIGKIAKSLTGGGRKGGLLKRIITLPIALDKQVIKKVVKPVARTAFKATRKVAKPIIKIAKKNPLAAVGGALFGVTGVLVGKVGEKLIYKKKKEKLNWMLK